MVQLTFRVLNFFGVTSEDYSVIFTKNATDSLRIAVEGLDQLFQHQDPLKKRKLLLLQDSHTSVHGSTIRFRNFELEVIESDQANFTQKRADVFLFTLMSNFCGKKYSPNIAKHLRGLNPLFSILKDNFRS